LKLSLFRPRVSHRATLIHAPLNVLLEWRSGEKATATW